MLWGRTSQKSYKWLPCSLYSPRLSLPTHTKTHSAHFIPPYFSCELPEPALCCRLRWTMSTKALSVPWWRKQSLGARAAWPWLCRQPLQRGTVTLVATPHIRQMARKPPVSPEKDTQPPGFLCVGASPAWSMVLQWVQSDAWHLLDLEEVSTATTFSALLNDE